MNALVLGRSVCSRKPLPVDIAIELEGAKASRRALQEAWEALGRPKRGDLYHRYQKARTKVENLSEILKFYT